MATFVLVHDTWHGGWCWSKVAPLLRMAGHAVFTPTLTGLGERVHCLSAEIDLDTHIQDTLNVLAYEGLHDVILVGHGYGGMVIAGVAQRIPERLTRLVYLDAMFPIEDARSVRELQHRYHDIHLWKRYEAQAWEPIEQEPPAPHVLPLYQAQQADRRRTGWPLLPPDTVPLFGVTDATDVRWLRERLTPHPRQTFTQRVTGDDTTDRRLRRTFILCPTLGEPDWYAVFGECIQQEGGRCFELAGGHDVMVTMSQELAQLFVTIAAMQ